MVSTHTVDTAMARRLVEAMAIQGASIIGQPGGWSVMLKLAQWRSLWACSALTIRAPGAAWTVAWTI